MTIKDVPFTITDWKKIEPFEHKEVEDAIKSCPCGGQFKFTNKLLCPRCKTPLSGSILDTIYFYILDKHIDGRKYNLWKKKDYWKKGYSTEAALNVLNFGLKRLKLKKIIAVSDPNNIASIKVIEKIGFKYIKVLKDLPKEYEFYNNDYYYEIYNKLY